MTGKRQGILEAQHNKNDEFYTLYEDVDKELVNYKDLFRDKVICCPCNDADKSFHQWFMDHKEEYGIKRVIAVHYSWDSFSSWYYDNDVKVPLKRNGDMFSTEVLSLMKQADYVVTNPPFSVFSEIISTLERMHLKYILLGSLLKFLISQARDLFLKHKLFIGFSIRYGKYGREFDLQDGTRKSIANAMWLQNVVPVEVPFLELTHTYSPELYPKYDDYDAIEVNSYKVIPKDYTGLMGVPISFLLHWNPEQFEIIGRASPLLNGKAMFARIIIKAIK